MLYFCKNGMLPKKMTISEFVKGPNRSVDSEEILERMLEELLGIRII